MGTGRIKKNTLRAKMLGILMLCAMTSLLAAGIVSYMALRMIQNDSIEDNMKMYLDQITRNTDGAYYDMLSIMNYMGPGGLVGNVTDSYLGATDNFDRFIEQRTLREEMAARPYTYIQTDERRITRYSTNPVIIQGQKLFSTTLSKGDYQVETREGYKIMAYRSQMGYINAVALPDNMYQNEINHWRMRMTLIIVASFLIFALSVFYLYRIICRPLNQFRRQMVQIGNGALQAVHEESDIAEFDSLMREVEQMKCQIENLISNMVEKEKSIQKTEYEKLIYQINPHFLLNTLNSVQWMAQMSCQRDISEFVQRLKKLLSYNLGKEGSQTTLRMELEIVKEYIALQQMRYDFVIEMHIEDGDYLDQPTVRMLFQPLVENANRYGLGDDEKISIQVFEDVARHLAVVTISDSGKGLTQEEIDEINQPFDYDWEYRKNENRGIGLRYVKAMLESFYDGQTSLFVNSRKGIGTRITILLPIRDLTEQKGKDTEVTLEEDKVGQADERIDR